VTVAISLGVMFATIAPLYAMWITLRKTSSVSYVEQLESRVADLEKQLVSCRARVDDLEQENVRLMRQVLQSK